MIVLSQVVFALAVAATIVVLLLLVLRMQFRPPRQPYRRTGKTGGLPAVFRPAPAAIRILEDGLEAFAVRACLIERATRELRVQYYMWHDDLTGRLLFQALLAAADRGVAVRLLLDDNTTGGMDQMLASLTQHPHIQVRLFNPFMLRRWRGPNYLFDFHRLNRRMHNKSLTVDDAFTLVGGRNVGDEYFAAHGSVHFADMDVLAAGPVVQDVATAFDSYWNCASAFAAEHVLDPVEPNALDQLRKQFNETARSKAAEDYLKLASALPLAGLLDKGTWFEDTVPLSLAVDPPAKGKGEIARKRLLVYGISQYLGQVENTLDLATAYFVPGHRGASFFSDAVNNGKAVRILTNSLASNDVPAVHAGYARYRKRMLRQGVQLFELLPRRDMQPTALRLPRFGASGSSLHAKIFIMDRKRAFIGSFNFDPRSLYLNCEMGLLIESPKLGERIASQMDDLTRLNAYAPYVDSLNRLRWRDPRQHLFKAEPESRLMRRFTVWVISWLPVEWLL